MSEPPSVRTLETALAQLNLSDPEHDADQRLSDGDRRVIGIHGYSVSFPGLPPDASVPLDQQSRYRTIDGTSDRVFGPRHMELIEIATRYAERYNRHIWQRCQDI